MADSDDFEEPTTTRRKWIFGGAAVVAAAGFGLWDLLRSRSRENSLFSKPHSGGELVVAFDGAADPRFILDAHNSAFAPHSRVIRSIYDNLTVLLSDQSIGPWLAESWDVSGDGRQYEFKLRQDVIFHDGTPFNAAAVKANFDRLANPANALYSAPCLGPYAGAEVLDPATLRVHLSEPFAPFLRSLSMTKLAIVSPAAVAKYGALFSQNPVGTGPFRFRGLTQGTEIRLERNPLYNWAPPTARHNGPAYIDRLTFRDVPEEATRVAVLLSGQVHAADLIPPQNLAGIRDNPDFWLLQRELLETNYSLALNVSKAPWDDEDIRHAVKLSLDIDEIVRTIYLGTLSRAWSPLSPSMFGSAERELAHSWRPDRARAAAILRQKGWLPGPDGVRSKNGQRLSISFIDTQGNREKRLDVIQLVHHQLLASGIDLTIDSQPQGAYAAKIERNEFDMTAGASYHCDPDMLRFSYSPSIRSALTGNKVNDPELTGWLEEGAREGDAAKRSEIYHKVQHKIIDKVYGIPIYVLLYNLAAARTVHGIDIDAHGFPQFHDAWLAG